MIQRAHQGCPCQGEVAQICPVRALAIVDAVDHLGDDAVDVQIALTMAMAAEVQRDIIQQSGEVRAVIQVEAAQEVLVGLAAAGMLGCNEAGHHFQQFGHPQQWPHGKVGATDGSLAGGSGNANEPFCPAEDQHFLQLSVCGRRCDVWCGQCRGRHGGQQGQSDSAAYRQGKCGGGQAGQDHRFLQKVWSHQTLPAAVRHGLNG